MAFSIYLSHKKMIYKAKLSGGTQTLQGRGVSTNPGPQTRSSFVFLTLCMYMYDLGT